MDRILYITNNMDNQCGGAVINRRNYSLLSNIYGNNLFIYEFEYVEYESKIVKWKNCLHGFYFGITNQHVREVSEIIKLEGINIVFISNSLFGCFATEIKKRYPNIIILSFFHNVEYIYAQEEYKAKKSIKGLLLSYLTYRFEKKMIIYVDYIVALNNRDARELIRIYHRTVDFVLPTSFEDRCGNIEYNKGERGTRLKLLFVGFNFFANVHGISWFVEQVMPYVKNVVLYIVGKGMELERARLERENVQVIGTVDSLDEWYKRADVVVSPIFLGSGMKTKTAEALMYGKSILGTKEAFEGYDLEFSRVGALCNTADEFIKKIMEIQKDDSWIERHGKYARDIYETQYSYKISLDRLKSFMREIKIKNSSIEAIRKSNKRAL